ncbi:carboxymuconolactone decarboxylase family protein [Streptomyces mashuensis]|nr:carboxymuconolactone decarboxylase family protein [Streptomyces mashuensis]
MGEPYGAAAAPAGFGPPLSGAYAPAGTSFGPLLPPLVTGGGAGADVRRDVLGPDAETTTPTPSSSFGSSFDDFVTRVAWGEVWARPGLGRRERCLVTLTALVVQGQLDALPVHVRAALRHGVTAGEIEETLLQASLHAGFTVAGAAVEVVRRALGDEGRVA